jgi:hypothetical protein
MWVSYNANPVNKRTGDCVIRALSKILGQPWEQTYTDLYVQGLKMHDMPSANAVWGAYLRSKGFEREAIPNTCPDCYTVEDFCRDNPEGKFILALSGHVIAVENGKFYDTWDSGNEVPIYYWRYKK